MLPQVHVEGGLIEGSHKDNVYKFLGVPYAAPPTGRLRWAPPTQVAPWSGVRDASRFSPRSVQTVGASFDSRVTEESEDCLYLNVWTTTLSPDAGQPVMVWIHGGGNLGGAGSEDATDGSEIVKQGVTLVSFNYRLGALGYLAHPIVGANFAVQDQIAVLRWVRDNIAKFGGDPRNVTVFGQSAGAVAVRTLFACPSADGLFHRAVIQSAGFEPPVLLDWWTYARAEATANALFERLGSTEIDVLHSVPIEELKLASHELSGVIPVPGRVQSPANLAWMPVPDGRVVTRMDMAEWPQNIPVLLGYTKNEARYFIKPAMAPPRTAFEGMARGFCGPKASNVMEALDSGGANTYEAIDELFSSVVWIEPARATLNKLAALSRPVYGYFFKRHSPGAIASNELAKHTAEIRYVFGNLVPQEAYDATDRRLSKEMQQAWVEFARDGVPKNADGIEWPRFTRECQEITVIDDTIRQERLPLSEVVRILGELRS